MSSKLDFVKRYSIENYYYFYSCIVLILVEFIFFNKFFLSVCLLIVPVISLCVIFLIPAYNFKLLRIVGLFSVCLSLSLSLRLWFNLHTLVNDFSIISLPYLNNMVFWFDSFSDLIAGLNFNISKVSILFIILTHIVILICVLISWKWLPFYYSLKVYLMLILLIEISCVGFFSSTNLLMFYMFFESVLIPMYVLIGVWGLRDRKIHASYQFFLYTFFGSLFMITGIIIIGNELSTYELHNVELYWMFLGYDKSLGNLLWLCFFIGFAIKVPMVPFHIWLPEAHVEAPTAGSIILASLLLKFGTYGMYRVLLMNLLESSEYYRRLIIVMSIVAILYASLITYVHMDLKKIIAYSSISHMGYVTLGLFLDNPEGVSGAVLMMLTHGFISGGLFFIVGILYERYGTRNIYYYGGLKNIMPVFTLFFFLLTLSNMNLPLTGGFVAELLVLLGCGALESKIISFLAAVGLITNGVYCIWLFNRLCMGVNINIKSNSIEYMDLDIREVIILLFFFLGILLIGLFPNIVLLSIENEIYFILWGKTYMISM